MLRLKASRRFLALVGLLGVLIASPAVSGVEPAAGGTYRLRFHHLHTGERLDVVYRNAVGYDPEALARVDRILRDWRKNDVHRTTRAFSICSATCWLPSAGPTPRSR